MEGLIINYRRGKRTQTTNQMIVLVPGYDKEKAITLVGKSAVFKCEGKNQKEILGKVSALHGSKGAVRIIFERGMPGQAIGGKVTLK